MHWQMGGGTLRRLWRSHVQGEPRCHCIVSVQQLLPTEPGPPMMTTRRTNPRQPLHACCWTAAVQHANQHHDHLHSETRRTAAKAPALRIHVPTRPAKEGVLYVAHRRQRQPVASCQATQRTRAHAHMRLTAARAARSPASPLPPTHTPPRRPPGSGINGARRLRRPRSATHIALLIARTASLATGACTPLVAHQPRSAVITLG